MISELKNVGIIEDDCIELLKKRATGFFAKLYKDKVADYEKIARVRSQNKTIHDL
jgi:hypothetical protein